jgi:hypothetical protein
LLEHPAPLSKGILRTSTVRRTTTPGTAGYPLFILFIAFLIVFSIVEGIIKPVVVWLFPVFTFFRDETFCSRSFILISNGFKTIQKISAGTEKTLFIAAFLKFTQIEQLNLVTETWYWFERFFCGNLVTINSIFCHA